MKPFSETLFGRCWAKLTRRQEFNLNNAERREEPAVAVEPKPKGDEALPMKHDSDATNGDVGLQIGQNYTMPKQKNLLVRRFYILSWIGSYDREKAVADLIAGITLGMTIIPQSIAYAALAGLSSEYGLYSAFIGSIIYVFFGTIPQVSIGPTSLMALLVLQFCADKPVEFVIVLAFMAGLFEFLMGVFQLGFIVNFIPSPVTKAFTSGTALIVALVQVKTLFGVRIKGIPTPAEFWNNIKVPDAIVGVICLVVLLLLRQLSSVEFKKKTDSTRRIKKLLWYISISRNALVVFTLSFIAYLWIQKSSFEAIPFSLSSKVSSGLPQFKLPPFSFESGNRTYGFLDICSELGSGLGVVPIVAVLANVAIAKAFVKDSQLDASQEMLTLGLCNLAGSFFSAMPTCGAFTRSAVSQASGVRTPMAGIYTGIIVFSALSILTPYFQYIPKSSLSAVLIAAVIFMVDFSPVKTLWKNNKKDFFSWTGCLLVCLIAGVEVGLLYGILLNMIFVLLRLGNPKVEVNLKQCDTVAYVHVKPLSDVYFSGVDSIRTEIRSACILYRYDFPIVLDCSRFMLFDATFIEMLTAVAKEIAEQKQMFILQSLSEKYKSLLPADNSNIHYAMNPLTMDDFLVPEKKANGNGALMA
ncbi:sodium-independent sulfate anion transporter [Musca vetustissima]|uniref:sodium-independent sulfate anion transporter n=1 Tax=Musca vetustissima TaxID=27455 RepID=UPI002AB7055F|nr:sodium-independent sulfate anion transporter [Musca vetustissima]